MFLISNLTFDPFNLLKAKYREMTPDRGIFLHVVRTLTPGEIIANLMHKDNVA